MIFSTKRAVGKMAQQQDAKLDPKVLAKIKNVNDDERLIAAGKLLQDLKRQLHEIENRLADARNQPKDGTARPPAAASSDAALLLTGGKLEDLAGQPSEPGERDKLVRQMLALREAIPQAQVRVQETEVEIIREYCRDLEPTAKAFAEQVLVAMDDLLAALRKQAVFYQTLSTSGWTENLRPAHWRLTPWDNIALFGGSRGAALPSLERHVEDRREIWKEGKKGGK